MAQLGHDQAGSGDAYEMGLHTEQLSGRTQQVYYDPASG